MIDNPILLSIANQKRCAKLSKDIDCLRKLEREWCLPLNLLVSIYLVETKSRPTYVRLCEYALVGLGAFFNLLLKKKVKNYTIGKCQLGLVYVLNYYGGQLYNHLNHLDRISFADLVKIKKSISTKEHFQILAYRVKSIFGRAAQIYGGNLENTICYVGEQYNGKFAYGLLLCEIIKSIDTEYGQLPYMLYGQA